MTIYTFCLTDGFRTSPLSGSSILAAGRKARQASPSSILTGQYMTFANGAMMSSERKRMSEKNLKAINEWKPPVK